MAFMELQVTRKGAMATADCAKCGATITAHEWASWDFNSDRDALRDGTAQCPQCCIGHADPATYVESRRPHYAARYSAPGYMDCTDWNFGTNRRALVRETRDLYGE